MAGAIRRTMLYLGLSEPEPDYDATDEGHAMERDHHEADDYAAEIYAPAEVTPLHGENSLRRIATMHPTTYRDAKAVGETFRAGTPVIMNLTKMTDAEAKRIVDFAAGLAFGLHGSIERVTNMVFLLSPATVEIEVQSQAPEPEIAGARFFDQS